MRQKVALVLVLQCILTGCGAARVTQPGAPASEIPSRCPTPSTSESTSMNAEQQNPNAEIASTATAGPGEVPAPAPAGTVSPAQLATSQAGFERANPSVDLPLPTGAPPALDPGPETIAEDAATLEHEAATPATGDAGASTGIAGPGQTVAPGDAQLTPGPRRTPVDSLNPGREGRPTATPCS